MKTNTSKALDIAKYFIELANKEDESDLTNLKLQKLLYFAQKKFLNKFKRPLFDDSIEAWDLGPVVRSVYNTFKTCGRFPITVFDVKFESKEISDSTKAFLNQVWKEYGKFSARHLVDLSHKKGDAWYKAYHSGKNEIKLKDMQSC